VAKVQAETDVRDRTNTFSGGREASSDDWPSGADVAVATGGSGSGGSIGWSEGGLRLIDLLDGLCAGRSAIFSLVRVAGDLMTRNPRRLTLDDRVETCLKLMTGYRLRHVPVIEPPGEKRTGPTLVGVISGRDIGRHLSPYVGKVGAKDSDRARMKERLSQVATRKPRVARPDTPLDAIITTMVRHHIDMIPVMDDDALVGIVTAGDILKLFVRMGRIQALSVPERDCSDKARLLDLAARRSTPDQLLDLYFRTVGDIMTEQVVSLEEDEVIASAMEAMQQGAFRHLPVVAKNGKLAGIVSDRNILRHLPGPRQPGAGTGQGFRCELFSVAPNHPNLKTPLKQIMVPEVTQVSPSCGIFHAAAKMFDHRISSLVVVDEDKDIRGVVTVTDFMRVLLALYEFGVRQSPT